jgi:hypothetical protein
MSIAINGLSAILIRLVFADYSGVLYYSSVFIGNIILVSHLKRLEVDCVGLLAVPVADWLPSLQYQVSNIL